jgi:hypothetical protein
MLYSKFSKNGALLNGVQPNPGDSDYEQVDPVAFDADQGDVLKIEHSETFALLCLGKGPGSYTFQASLNGVPVTAANKITADNGGSVIGENGQIAYDGAQDTTLVLGDVTGKLATLPVFSVTKFLNVLGKPNSFVLAVGKGRALYLFSLNGLNGNKSIDLFHFQNNGWVSTGNFLTPGGRDFLETDVVGFKVTAEKIQLMFNEEGLWEVGRTWNLTPSSADLGTLSKPGPYTFGESVDLTIGNKAGMYTMGFANQAGAQFVLTQGINVTDQTAVAPVTTTNPIQTILPIAAAIAATTTGEKVTTPATDKGTAVETTDWGKIMTWSGVGLGVVAVIVLLVMAFRKN